MDTSERMRARRAKRARMYPYWCKADDNTRWEYPTYRHFQRKKRNDLHRLAQAFNEFRLGVAYVPGYREHFDQLESAITALETAMNTKNWK